ncbi:MAG: LPS assembly protein LptD, partial [Xanthomonadales bacterium]|nr:LPS assembly protein LptD [Xanthomonadales bacterium]
MTRNCSRTLILSLALLASLQGVSYAAEEPDRALSCPGPSLAPMLRKTPDRSQAPIYLQAYQFDAGQNGPAEARKKVELRRADQLLTTELLRYDPGNHAITTPGAMAYEDSVVHISGSSARYNFDDESGRFTEVDYGLTGTSAKGSASEIILDSGNHSLLHELYFTTCPGDKPEWELSAKELALDFEAGTGTAKHAKLKFFDIPILYLPYMTFPIDDRRKTGFLYPALSSANDNGFEIGIPFYWNIAPNQDATIQPRYFTDRGAMITAQYRFMSRRTGGSLDFDWLPSDKKTRELRYHYRFGHGARLSERWRTAVVVDRVSDDQYFQDFANSLAAASRQYLRSKAGVYGGGHYWNFSIIADDFQVVDSSVRPTNEPYRRLPRIAFDLDRSLGLQGLRLRLGSELVYFDRDVGVTGSRLDLLPMVEWNISTDWGYMKPSVGYRFTSYDLDWHGEQGDSSPSRATEILSFDTGLFLQRDGNNGRMQTLEPRLFYLYVPYEDQRDLPDFDSAPFTFGFSQLFHYNRFTGA